MQFSDSEFGHGKATSSGTSVIGSTLLEQVLFVMDVLFITGGLSVEDGLLSLTRFQPICFSCVGSNKAGLMETNDKGGQQPDRRNNLSPTEG